MKIFKISQNKNTDYDTYDSAVVFAKDEESARKIHPSSYGGNDCWTESSYVHVEYLGKAKKNAKAGVICSSFNAG